MKKLSHIFILMLCIFLFVGCKTTNKGNNKDEQEQEQVKDPVKEPVKPVASFGGELKILMRNPNTLNPLLNNDRTVDQVLKLVFDSLFLLDEQEKPMPNLVESYELSSSATTITINLKKNILFHDGEELHSDDVIYSINTIKNASEDSIYKVCVENYKRVSAVDEYTFKIYFDQPFAFSLYTLNFPIIPKHHYDSNENSTLNPIGTGAYSFVNFATMKELNLKANQKWFKGNLYVEKIKGVITRDKNSDSDAFNQKVVDLINPTKFDWQHYAETKGVSLTEYDTYYYTFLGFNFNNNILSDKNIRKAIAYAIDRESIIKNEFLNHAHITDYPIHPISWLNKEDALMYNKNIEKSKELITTAGYSDSDGDELLDKNINSVKQNLSLRLLVNNENPLRLNIANKIKEYLEEVGFIINIDSVDNITYSQKIMNKDFDILLSEWKLSPIPDFTFAFHSSQIEEGNNFINYSNVDMDRILETIFRSTNEKELLTAIGEFKNIIAEELPYYSLFFRTSAIISNQKVYGQLNPSIYNNYRGIENLFIFEQ
ncbi:MAG: peptide ABC transporter substrate-binding protein [Vallitalea sp.]|nr:peptide ABC transporter substrate-binding protein [Vallitalea sp.]